MGKKLTSLLIQENVASIERIDEALQRQVIFGGRLGTNLLELGVLEEEELVHYLAVAKGIMPATSELYLNIDANALQLLSEAQIERSGVFPIRLHPDHTAEALVLDPLTPDQLQELRQQTRFDFIQFITPEFRFRQALHHFFAKPLNERNERLLQRYPQTMRLGQPSRLASPPSKAAVARHEPIGPPGVGWTLDEITLYLRDCYVRDVILNLVQGFAGNFASRRLLLVVARNYLQGYLAQGEGVDLNTLRRLRLRMRTGGAIERVCRGDTYYQGPPIDGELAPLYEGLGLEPPPSCLLLPILVGPRAGLVLLMDHGHRTLDPLTLEPVFIVINEASEALERIIRLTKQKRLPPQELRIPPLPERIQQRIQEANSLATQQHPNAAEAIAQTFLTQPQDALHPPSLEELTLIPDSLNSAEPSADPSAASSAAVSVDDALRQKYPRPMGAEDAFLKDDTPSADRLPVDGWDLPDLFVEPPQEPARASHALPKEDLSYQAEPLPEDAPVLQVEPQRVDAGTSQESLLFDFTAAPPDDLDGPALSALPALTDNWPEEPNSIDGVPLEDLPPEPEPEPAPEPAPTPEPTPEPEPALTPEPEPELSASWPDEPTAPPEDDDAQAPAAPIEGEPQDQDAPQHQDDAPAAQLPDEPAPTPNTDAPEAAPEDAAPEPEPAPTPEPAPEPHHDEQMTVDLPAEPSRDHMEDDIPVEEAPQEAPALNHALDTPPDTSEDAQDEPQPQEAPEPTPDPDHAHEAPAQPQVAAPEPRSIELLDPSLLEISLVELYEPPAASAEPTALLDAELFLEALSADEEAALIEGALLEDYAPQPQPEDLPLLAPETEAALLRFRPLVDDLCSGDADRERDARDALLASGEAALPALLERFPGPIRVDHYNTAIPALPPIDQHGPLLAALVELGDLAAPAISSILEHPNVEVRFYSAFFFLRVRYEPVIVTMHERLFDRDSQVREAARYVLRSYRHTPAFRRMCEHLYRALRGRDTWQIEQAARSLAGFHDTRAVPILIDLLEHPQRRIADIALRELNHLCLEDLGNNPRRWLRWWEEHAATPRWQWLIDAMNHNQREIRLRAAFELRQIPGLLVNYTPDAARSDRQRAQTVVTQYLLANPTLAE